jgi:predicted phage-related endonuclease
MNDRKTYIGSSDAAMVADLSPYGSPLKVWNRLVGIDDPPEQSLRMYLGEVLEPSVVTLYEARTGRSPAVIIEGHPNDTEPIRSAEFPFIGAHPDRDHLEIKTQTGGREWGEDESTVTLASMTIPLHVFVQVQHIEFVMEWDTMDVAAWLLPDDFRRYIVPRDETVVSALVAAEVELWEDAQSGRVPAKSDPESRKAYLRSRFPVEREPDRAATPEELALVAEWRAAKRLLAEAEDAEALAGDIVREAIGPAAGFTGVVTYHAQTRRTIDADKLRAELRRIDRLDILDRVRKASTFRVLRMIGSEDGDGEA